MFRTITALLILLPVFAIAQRVDLDRYKFTSQVRTLPALTIDSTYHTYRVRVESSRMMQPYFNELAPANSVWMDGWRKLEGNAHVEVQVKVEDLLPESMSVKEREEIIKDRNGKETGRKKFYWQEVVYTFSAFAEVTDFRGAFIKRYLLADRGAKHVYRGPEFAIRHMAEGYFLVNSLSLTGQLFKSCVNRAMIDLSDQLTYDFGYGQATINDQMWILDSRKHPEYMAHRQAFQAASEILFSLSANRPLDGVREQLQPVIDYFESVKKRYTSTSKHDRKLRYASFYNLAVIYYYLDDPQAMKKEAAGLIMNDFDARDGRAFESTALYLKGLFERTGINSRHFAIDTAQFKGPGEGSPVAAY